MKKVITLGELIDQLKSQKQDNQVRFDFGRIAPVALNSWRGVYSELALGYNDDKSITVAELLTICENAIDKIFHGYKGGDYTATRNTSVYVANWGQYDSPSTVVVKVKGDEYLTILKTKQFE